jgi:hypothetical protein
MKITTTAFAVLLASIFMTACAKKESAAPAEAAPAATAPAEAAPPATSEAPANTEDSPATGGDKVAPKSSDTPPPPSN